jgi:hypothetical protein
MQFRSQSFWTRQRRISFGALSLLLSAVLLVGCGGSGQTAPPTVVPNANHNSTVGAGAIASADDPSPANAADIDQLPSVTDSARGPIPSTPRTPPGQKTTQSVLLNMEHGEVGFVTAVNGGGTIDGIEAIHTVYSPEQVTLSPNNGPGTQTLFAPTTHGPNGDCLEVGTWYFGPPTMAAFYVFDFCTSSGGSYVFSIPIDSVFESTYVANHDSLPAYRTETILKGNMWHALLYNEQTKKWERVYTQAASPAGPQNGWSIEEYYFNAGNCPTGLPTFIDARIKYHDSTTNTWRFAQNGSVAGLTIYEQPSALGSAFYGSPSCFVSPDSNSTGLSSYVVTFPDKRWDEWYTYSTGQ